MTYSQYYFYLWLSVVASVSGLSARDRKLVERGHAGLVKRLIRWESMQRATGTPDILGSRLVADRPT